MQAVWGSDRHNGEEVERLWRRWHDDQDVGARNRLVLTFSPLVKYLATRKVRELPAHCDLEDLVSAGLLALLGAVDRFDPARGAPIDTYIWTRVSGAILDELRRQDWAPRSVRRDQRAIEAAHAEWLSRTGRPATTAELADLLGMPVKYLEEHFRRLERAEIQSLNEPCIDADHHAAELGDLLINLDDRTQPETAAMSLDRTRAWKQAICSLTEREQRIFLMAVVEDRQGDEIAGQLGVSPSRISQILTHVRHKLARQMQHYESEHRGQSRAA